PGLEVGPAGRRRVRLAHPRLVRLQPHLLRPPRQHRQGAAALRGAPRGVGPGRPPRARPGRQPVHRPPRQSRAPLGAGLHPRAHPPPRRLRAARRLRARYARRPRRAGAAIRLPAGSVELHGALTPSWLRLPRPTCAGEQQPARRDHGAAVADRTGWTPNQGGRGRRILALRLQSRAVMNKTLTALAIFLILGSTSAAFAQGPDLTAHASGSTRTERRFSLASVTSVTGGFPMVGLQAQYQLADRLALTSQASLGILAADAGLGARVFISAERRSGLYLDLSGHA